MLKGPWQRQRTAAEEYQYDRLAGVDDGFEQFLLAARQAEIRARSCLPAHVRRLTKCQDHQVCALGRGDCRGDLLVAALENPDPLGADYVALPQAPG